MKAVSAAFLAMLEENDTLVEADLYTITLVGGEVLRYTSAQQSISYNGNVYQAAYLDSAPGFHRGQWRCTRGLDTDELEVDILFDAGTTIGGVAPAPLVSAGALDMATLQLDKALAPNWNNPVVNGVVNLFTGVIGDTKVSAGKIELTVSSMLIYLQTQFPRNYFLTGCNHCLFDAGCSLNKASYAVEGSVSAGGTVQGFNTNLTQADDYFSIGYLVWTSGANNGEISRIKTYLNASGAVQLIYPLGAIPQAGDTFTAYPGCDKTLTTCQSKFNNSANFRGFPFVPTPETLEVGGTGSQPIQGVGGKGGAGLSALPRAQGGQAGKFSLT